jgi:hypothetical protein
MGSRELSAKVMATVKAGFGKVDITPRVGVELCGFGPYLNRHSTRVLEPLYARAMAVDLDGARWVILSADLITFTPTLTQRIRAIVRDATGLSDDQIMMHATHTHAAPCTIPELIGWGDPDDPYLEILPRFVAKACIDAVNDLKEATFHHAEVDAIGFGYNRELPDPGRTNDLALEGKWITDKPEETDTRAHTIRIDRAGKVSGFLTYFSCHPVVCCANNREIHGDFVGVATNRIEKEHPGAVGLFLQGAQGDINPIYVHGPAEQSLLALESFGSRFAEVMRNGVKAAKPFDVSKVSSALSDEPYTLAPIDENDLRRRLAEHEQVLTQALLATDEHKTKMAMVYAKSIRGSLARIQRGESFHRPCPIQSLRLGPITFTSTPFEMMHRIKRRFQVELGDRALLMGITNGFLGYAPLREYYQTPPVRYSAYWVPYMLGWVPFTENIEDEVLAAALRVAKQV